MIIRGRRKINLITLSVKLTLRGCLMGLGLTLRGRESYEFGTHVKGKNEEKRTKR